MSQEDRDKWDRRYAEDSYRKNNPVLLLQQWLPSVPPGRALDIACGAGRNALFLAEAGYRVDAVDISAEGLRLARAAAAERGLEINWLERDLDRGFVADGEYQLIVVLWYVNLPLIAALGSSLAPGGYLLSEQHLQTESEVIGPQNPRFRVAPGALRDCAAGLEIRHYDESLRTTDDGEALASAQLVARRRA